MWGSLRGCMACTTATHGPALCAGPSRRVERAAGAQMWTSNLGDAAAGPPKKLGRLVRLRKRKESVHSGFLKSWRLNGLRVPPKARSQPAVMGF